MTDKITITARVTTITSITLIYMATIIIITMKRRAVTILPTENSDVNGNTKDPYVNYVDHHDDNCEKDVITVFRREKNIQHIAQKPDIFNVLFDCDALILTSHTAVTDLQVVQKIGRNTTIHVITLLMKPPQISMVLRPNARQCQQHSPSLNQIR